MGSSSTDLFSILREKRGDEKIKFLEKMDYYKEAFYYAYNPFKRFYLSPPDIEGVDFGLPLFESGGFMNEEAKTILESLSNRVVTGRNAFEMVCDFMAILNKPSAILFKRILAKDLRVGVALTTIRSVWPGLIPETESGEEKIEFMNCSTFNPEKAVFPLLASPKKDGNRAQAIHSTLWSRNKKKYHGMSHIEKELAKYDFGKDGELVVPGHGFDSSSGLIRNKSDVPEAVYWIFDCPDYPSESRIERYSFLCNSIKETDYIRIMPMIVANNLDDIMKYYHEQLALGEEGLVIYTANHEYRDTRAHWFRLIPRPTADLRVIGFEEGAGKLKGSLGKLIVDYDGVPVKIGTGFSEKPWSELTQGRKEKTGLTEKEYESSRRGYIWVNQEKFLGQICTVEFKQKTKAGSLRQPSFKVWRWDKNEPNFG